MIIDFNFPFYDFNEIKSFKLFPIQAMIAHNVKNFVLSSSATVYGEPQFLPLTEKHPIGNCQNSYGNTKLCCELILKVNQIVILLIIVIIIVLVNALTVKLDLKNQIL